MIMPELTEQASSEESLPETGMIGASDLFPVSTTANEESARYCALFFGWLRPSQRGSFYCRSVCALTRQPSARS